MPIYALSAHEYALSCGSIKTTKREHIVLRVKCEIGGGARKMFLNF